MPPRRSPCTTRFNRTTSTRSRTLLNPQQRIAYENWRAARERAKRLAQQNNKVDCSAFVGRAMRCYSWPAFLFI